MFTSIDFSSILLVMAFFTFIVVLFLLYLLLKLSRPDSRMKKYGDKLPGPAPLPLIGNGLVFLTSKTLVKALDELCEYYGPVMRLWLGSKLWICLCDPADIGVFLSSTKHLNKSDLLRLLDSWLGTKGLVTSDADVWRTHRKLLTPSFRLKSLRDSVDIIQNNSLILSEQLADRVDGDEFDILEYVEKCSLDIICETAMGVKLRTQTLQQSTYLDSLKQIKQSTIKRLFSAWLHPELIFKLSSPGRKYYKKLAVIKSEVQRVIAERRKILDEQKKKDTEATNATNDDKKESKMFLDFMLTGSDFTDDEIENEVQTFMFAGQDTTMQTISFCLYSLSRHPEIQDRCVEEIRTHLGNKNENFTYQQYKSLKYLENVIKETLRIYTAVPLIARKVEEDIVLPSGYTLPAGAAVNFNLLALHHNEKYFPNPEQFMPERFENEDAFGSQPYAFIPFSAGPRNCLGQKFAILEMKAIIAALLQRYKFLPSDRVKSLTLETGIVLRSLEKCPVKITIRQE